MKKISTLIAFILISFVGFSQTKGISYQAVIIDPNPIQIPGSDVTAQPYVSKEVWIRFGIYAGTTLQYEELHKTKTDEYGLVNLIIGGGVNTGKAGTFTSLSWDGVTKNIITNVSFDQGGRYTEVSNQKLTYTPYTLLAETAVKLAGVLPIASGGTGATNAIAARTNLGLGNLDNTADVDKPVSIPTLAILDTKESVANKSTNIIADSASSVKYPSVKAIKEYIDNRNSAMAQQAQQANRANLAAKATALETPRTINGIPFDGTTNITIPVGVTPPDADATTKGLVKLAGDLTGTADAPAIAANSVTTSKIIDGAVTTGKLAAGAVTDAKITSVAGSKVTGNIAGNAANITGMLAVSNGGTGATTATGALANLGAEAVANKSTDLSADANSTQKYPSVKLIKDYVDTRVAAAGVSDGSITSAKIADATIVSADIAANAGITNAQLANSSLTLGSTNIVLGGMTTSLSGLSTVSATNFSGALAGNASTATKLAATKNINGAAFDGSADITVTADATTLTGVTLASNVLNSSLTSVGTITSGIWSGTAIANNNLANSSLTLGSTNITLGATTSTLAGLSTVTATNFAGALTGNASTATKLASTKNINGIAFDGSSDITVTADATTLTGIVPITKGGTGSSTQNFVDLTTGQTINGQKIFSGDAYFNGVRVGLGTGTGNYIQNTSLGKDALSRNTSGEGNTAVGYGGQASGTTASANTSMGFAALSDNTTGEGNTALGYQALQKNTGSNNIAIGSNTMYLSQNANDNIVLGNSSLDWSTNGAAGNIILGKEVMRFATTASNNIVLGNGAGSSFTTENNNLLLGAGSNISAGVSNSAAIGYGATVDASNKIQLGNANVTTVNTSGTITAAGFSGPLTGNASTATLANNISATTNTSLTSLANLTTVGTITSGIWSSTAISVANGGTGTTTASGALTNLGAEAIANKSTDLSIDANSTDKYPSVKLIKDYVDTRVASAGVSDGTITSVKITDATIVSADIAANAGITNGQLANSTTMLGSTTMTLGGTVTSVTGLTSLSATTFTGTLSGTAATADKLTTSRAINGVAFDGSADITVTADAGTLTGTTLKSTVTGSSLTSVGTITSGIWSGTAIAIANGGTGSTTKNFVDLTTAQTIAGTKTFSNTTIFNSDISVNGITAGLGNGQLASNAAFGNASMATNTTGYSNAAFGGASLGANTTGFYNSAFGKDALHANTTGIENTGLGLSAMYSNLGGSYNTAIGSSALVGNTSASYNVAMGRQALGNATTGGYNVAIGAATLGTNTTGTNNTVIGYGADVASAALTNATAIGNGAIVSASNTIQLGNSGVTNVVTSGTITAAGFSGPLTGNASTATLANNISATANTTLTTLANLTSVGTITSGTWSGTAIAIANGGTGSSTVTGAKTNLGLNNVENTALSTWSGSTNLTTVGDLSAISKTFMFQDLTLGYGTPNGAKIQTDANNKYISFMPAYGVESTRLWPSGNVTIQHAGTYADNGYTLEVKGTTNIVGNTTITGTLSTTGTISSTAGFAGQLTGNASTATKLATSRAINGVSFDGSGDITIAAGANTLTGTTLASNVVSSSLTSVGTITSGVWSGTAIAIANGGTGSTTKNFVDLTTAQTIAGAKTFSSDLTTNGIRIGVGSGAVSSNYIMGNVNTLMSATGTNNMAFGDNTGMANTSGIKNLALGSEAFRYNTTGSHNVGIGFSSLRNNTTGSYNIAIGENANSINTTGSYLTAIGYGADFSSAALTNATAIGNGAIATSSNSIQLGNSSVTSVVTSGTISATGFTGPLTGNANTATALAAGKTISLTGDVTYTSGSFDGSSNVTGSATLTNTAVTAGSYGSSTAIPTFTVDSKGRLTAAGTALIIAEAGTLSGTTLASNVVNSSLTSVGTITSGVWSGTVISSNKGGAGFVSGLLKANGSGVVSAAVAGTDYQAPLTAGTSFIAPNAAITAATKTKITYDAFGLVTAGADATTADIASSLDKRYVTDVQSGVLSNTSGTNTGDETASTIKTKLGIATLSGSNTGDQTITLTGDVTGTGTGSFAATLTNTAVTVGSYGSTTTIPTFTVDAKGRLTAAGSASIIADAGTLSGTSLKSTVTGSSLTSVGTITAGTWSATVIGSNVGGAGSINGLLKANGSGVVSAAVAGTDYFNPNGSNIKIGYAAGGGTQGAHSIAIGSNAAQSNTQAEAAVAIGYAAGQNGQGANSVAIGAFAGNTQAANSIALNASGVNLNPVSSGFYVDPVNNASTSSFLFYNPTSKEITYNAIPTLNQNTTGNATTATTAGNITATSNTTLTSLVNLATVGTITAGTWSATTIDVAHGGTGVTSSTGSGSLVLNTSPTLVTPLLVTPNIGAANGTSLILTGYLSGAAGTFSSTLTAGASTLASAAVTGDLTVNTNKFTVAGASGNTLVAGTLGVTGATTLSSTLGVTGATTLGSTLAVTGAGTFSSTLSAGASTLASASITGAATVGGTLGVTGATTLTGAATISNTTASTSSSTGALVVKGGVGVAGNLSIGGTIEIDGGTPGAGKVLISDANGVASWSNAVGSTVLTSTTTYAITLAEAYVFYNGASAGAFTIPAAAAGNAGKAITIKNKTAFGITITPLSSGTIYVDNATGSVTSVSIGIEASNNWIKLVSDGAQWNVIRALF